MTTAGMPIDLRDAAFVTLGIEQTEATRALARVDLSALRLAVVGGPVGCGKTWALCLRVADYCQPDPSARDLSWIPNNGHHAPSCAFILAGHVVEVSRLPADASNARTCAWLLIDDLGTEPLESTWWLPAFDTLLNERINAGRKTFITTNIDPDTFRVRYGDRIWSRLHAPGSTFIWVDGEDMRVDRHILRTEAGARQ